MSEYLSLRLLTVGSVIVLGIMLNLVGKLAKTAFHHTHVRRGSRG